MQYFSSILARVRCIEANYLFGHPFLLGKGPGVRQHGEVQRVGYVLWYSLPGERSERNSLRGSTGFGIFSASEFGWP